jgi:microcystin-dependent protein
VRIGYFSGTFFSRMNLMYVVVALPLVLLFISSIIIWKLQKEITLSKEINMRSLLLLEQLSTQRGQDGPFEYGGRRLGSSNTANCSAVVEQALIPVGTIMDYAGKTAPTGFLLCDGSEVDKTVFHELYLVIRTTYGKGNSDTTFNLPDLRGRSSFGAGNGTGLTPRTLGIFNGEENHLLITNEMPSHTHVDIGHTHNVTDGGHHHDNKNFQDNNLVAGDTNSGGGSQIAFSGSGNLKFYHFWDFHVQTGIKIVKDTVKLQSSGGDQGHNNMPPFLILSKIIKY